MLAPDLVEAVQHSGKHVPCPIHGGKDGFRLFNEGGRAIVGAGVCNTCGYFPNGFAVLGWLYGWTGRETILKVSNALDGIKTDPGVIQERIKSIALLEEQKILSAKKMAREWWVESVPVNSRENWPLRRYFKERNLEWYKIRNQFPTDSFMYHPWLPYYEKGQVVDHFPALLSAARNIDGKVVFLHRTYIAKNGHGKAPVSCPRKTTPFFEKNNGAAIRLGGSEVGFSQIDVAEGIETALSVYVATGHRTWSLVNTGLMQNWLPPEGVDFVNIWADKDLSGGGIEAANSLAAKLRSAGIMSSIHEPEAPIERKAKSFDWNNALMRFGPEAFSGFFFWGTR